MVRVGQIKTFVRIFRKKTTITFIMQLVAAFLENLYRATNDTL